MNEIQKAILSECADRWFKNPAGITASDLARKFGISNEEACKEVELLCEAGYGKMNRDADFTELLVVANREWILLTESGSVANRLWTL